jgi:chromosome segregation ATPase
MSAKLLFVSMSLLIAATSGATAGGRYDPDRHQAEEAARIEAGRRDGSITYFEGRALRQEQAQIARRESELRADGSLSRRDRQELKERLGTAERHIAETESNSRRRWWLLPRVGN